MASSVTAQEIIEDDDFDWEAAVKEIDIACEGTEPSTSVPPLQPYHHATHPQRNKKLTGSRQTTLDHFISAAPRNPLAEKELPKDSNDDEFDGHERPFCVEIDAEAAKTWIYPANRGNQLREYQLSITRTALFSNTLVALPTGLGKTFIAAVVMYNYFRWFPEGKIVFAATSRPLVQQQIKACHYTVGIPQEWTIDMTGEMRPEQRVLFWKEKRVLFVTPQVLENDIQSGRCVVKHIVCLVIDEAHRATGNHSYCVAVRELMAVPVQLRILALTATPGSKQQIVQNVINNLHISTLEYRDESHSDVSQYVNNRTVELIKLAMSANDAEINKLLLDIVRQYASRLCAIGVLQNRDVQTLSPCQLLDSRSKFREAPPQELPHLRHNEVEGYYGILITLCHIRRLLGVHGTRPAYEMLEEKLQKGFFAKFMSKNEVIWKIKLLMERSLSHGEQNPKLLKLLEVINGHFKSHDPKKSGVIIFTNFRGSVRDIMGALASCEESVKAVQFIGQSSGKKSKGQSQKVQQAVLEKFRAHEYNVLVATSVAEEGLDIREVDLVVCFDANVSSVRMIQRQGRTGRKNDGRVVVLTGEGAELNAYMRKQAQDKAIKKHMRNGGIHSFTFHPSPRMIPHTVKPEVQFLEMSIEDYVPRGSSAKDDQHIQEPTFEEKLTDEESELLAKYFHPKDNMWKASLIVFPHFQAFPSRVHNIMHSCRTGILIAAMQQLHGLFVQDAEGLPLEDETSSSHCSGVENMHQYEIERADTSMSSILKGLSKDDFCLKSERDMNSEAYPVRAKDVPTHSYLFSSEFVSVDPLGKVLIVSIPLLPFKRDSHFNDTVKSHIASLSYSQKHELHQLRTSQDAREGPNLHQEAFTEVTTISDTLCTSNRTMENSMSQTSDTVTGIIDAERVMNTNFLEKIYDASETTNFGSRAPPVIVDESCNDLNDSVLSPRLTNFIESGVVPESPIVDGGLNLKVRDMLVPENFDSPVKLCSKLLIETLYTEKSKEVDVGGNANGRDDLCSINEDAHTPLLKVDSSGNGIGSNALGNLSNTSSSKDWHLSSGEKSASVKQIQRFKRLRKHGTCKRNILPCVEENLAEQTTELPQSSPNHQKHCRVHTGRRLPPISTRAFIEEEAEVSLEAEASSDEDDDLENNSYDSFLDDRVDITQATTQAESSGVDMMAIYRRSLLSQSPVVRNFNCLSDFSPNTVGRTTRMSKSVSTSGTTRNSLQSSHVGSVNSSDMASLEKSKEPSDLGDGSLKGNERRLGGRKRKLSAERVASVPSIKLEQECPFHLNSAPDDTSIQSRAEKTEASLDMFDDDQFYEGLNLDEVEAQATMLLRNKTNSSMLQQNTSPAHVDNLGSPSFDLGI